MAGFQTTSGQILRTRISFHSAQSHNFGRNFLITQTRRVEYTNVSTFGDCKLSTQAYQTELHSWAQTLPINAGTLLRTMTLASGDIKKYHGQLVTASRREVKHEPQKTQTGWFYQVGGTRQKQHKTVELGFDKRDKVLPASQLLGPGGSWLCAMQCKQGNKRNTEVSKTSKKLLLMPLGDKRFGQI